MKPGIHPEYRTVVFEDSTGGQRWVCRSTIRTARTTVWEADGEEYPHVLLDVSMYTHPSYTGTMTLVDSAGRVERFNMRHGRRVRNDS